MARTYREMLQLKTFGERFEYLKLSSSVGVSTFGFERYLNQILYQSKRWKQVRRDAIVRDGACDLGIEDREIIDRITIHHIEPITIEDIEIGRPCVFDLNNLITTAYETHNAIHYGDISLIPHLPPERKKGDTCPWRVF